MSKSWDKGILKKLKALTGRGLSAAEIGKRLGLSKNAVVGKMHRMGWNPKAVEDGKVSDDKAGVKKPGVKKTAAKPAKTVAKKTEKNTAKTVAKKSAKVAKSVKDTKTVKPVDKKTVVKTKTVAKPGAVKKTAKESKPVKVVAKPEVKPEPKPEIKKPVAVGRPIAGRAGGSYQRAVQHALEMAGLKANQCRWPIGDPDSDDFHFCGKTVFVGKPYCYEHCKMAYQFAPPKKK